MNSVQRALDFVEARPVGVLLDFLDRNTVNEYYIDVFALVYEPFPSAVFSVVEADVAFIAGKTPTFFHPQGRCVRSDVPGVSGFSGDDHNPGTWFCRFFEKQLH